MSRPKLSFHYQTYASKDLDEVRSNATQRTGVYSVRSTSSSKPQLQRVDQIQPTRIVIPTAFRPPSSKTPKLNTLRSDDGAS